MVMLRTLSVILAISLGVFAASAQAPRSMAGPDFRELPKFDQLESYRRAAYRGSGPAANSLATYYMKADTSGRLERYWTAISAENGDPVGEYNLAYYYLDLSSPYPSVDRAKFWLRRSAEKGNKMAQRRLAEPLRVE